MPLVSLLLSAVPSAAVGTAVTITPSDNLGAALESLSPLGVTELRLAPGVYDADLAGANAVDATDGTPTQRIRVTADDPDNPPIIRGNVWLQTPSYWTLDHLVFEAERSTAGYEGLRMQAGTGWILENSELRRAADTPAGPFNGLTLLNVASYGTEPPMDWKVRFNCLHDGGTDEVGVSDPDRDHLVYVTSKVPGQNGYVARNIMFRSPNGSAVKINSSNVKVNWNTIQDVNGGAMIVQENAPNADGSTPLPLYGITTKRNLVQTTRPTTTGQIFAFWGHDLPENGSYPGTSYKWALNANYVYSSNSPTYLRLTDPVTYASYVTSTGGANSSNPAYNPTFAGLYTCDGYQPQLSNAQNYGRYATDGVSLD